MDLFDSSGNWIIALGKTLVFSLLIGLLILSILKVILQFVSGKYSGLRYWLAVSALMIFTLSAGLLFFLFYAPDSIYPGEANTAINELWSGGLFQNLVLNEKPSALGILYMISTYLYFGGILVMMIRLAISYASIRGLRNESYSAEGDWARRFSHLKAQLGVGQKVELLLSDRISVPGLIGVLKPAIIVPASMLSHLPASQVETILLHELYHIRRLDYLVNTVQLLLEALFFYNPAVWILSKQIRIEREKCCDDGVLEKTSRPEDYATALYQLAMQHQGITSLSPSAAGTNQYHLLKRIKRILNQSTMKSNIREKLYALLLMAGGFILLFTLSGFSQGFSIIHHDYFSQEVTQETEEPRSAELVSTPLPVGPVAEPRGIPESMPETIVVSDTLPDLQKEEKEKAMQEAMDEIDWEEIKEEIESAKQQALEDIDWEEIKKDMEAARKEVMEEINWDEIKKEMEEARLEAFEEIDWEAIRKEMENSRIHMDSVMKDFDFDFDFNKDFDFDFDISEDFDIDLDQMKIDLEKAMEEMKNIDFEKMKADIKKSIAELEERSGKE